MVGFGMVGGWIRLFGDAVRVGVGDGGGVGDGCLSGVNASWDKSTISWVEAYFKGQGGDGG